MGQYFIVVNEDKQEYIHPHRFGHGMKLWEVAMNAPGCLSGLAMLLARGEGHHGRWAGDRIVLVGDYDDSKLYQKAQEEFTDVSEDVRKLLLENDVELRPSL
jgi:hypothetical protein